MTGERYVVVWLKQFVLCMPVMHFTCVPCFACYVVYLRKSNPVSVLSCMWSCCFASSTLSAVFDQSDLLFCVSEALQQGVLLVGLLLLLGCTSWRPTSAAARDLPYVYAHGMIFQQLRLQLPRQKVQEKHFLHSTMRVPAAAVASVVHWLH
jgi:hypothetical protein